MFNNLRVCVTCVVVFVLTSLADIEADDTRFQIFRVAHAGGGLGKSTYTNSYEALTANLDKGFKYFEIDFTFTSDDRLVCLHDWELNFKRTFGFETKQRLSYKAFKQLSEENKRSTNCTLKGLAKWMRKNPNAYIVTDVKDNNLQALKRIHKKLPNADERVIPQVYDPMNFEEVSDMGFHQVIWTLYRYSGSAYDVIQWVDQWQTALAVTMPKDWAESPLPGALFARGIPTYAHTINKAEEMDRLINEFGISEIYTDFLVP